MPKFFVLDTNVLLHNSDSIDAFADNIVVLPMAVIEELDKFKSHSDELGRNARQVIRQLDNLRTKGRLGEGIKMENGGILKIDSTPVGEGIPNLDMRVADNKILSVAYKLLQAKERVIFVSKDINARLKADALGIDVQDFEKQKVNFDELYAGFRALSVSPEILEKFFKQEEMELAGNEFFPNEFILLEDETNPKHSGIGRAKDENTVVHLLNKHETVWQIHPRNKEQRMALELLLDPEVSLVTLVGQAGTGKTLLAVAAALESVISFNRYDRLLVSRPIIPMGKDIGFLPGDKDEKLANWMQPIFDNLTYLMGLHSGKDEGEASVRLK
ncbi:MAG: PIN domain-containing protein, partial [Desulfobulbaceae bacterium]|nr:PIN domain-containing protein [Desulfobulbaceae bacterium]